MQPSKSHYPFLFWAIIGILSLIRFYKLDHRPLNVDEISDVTNCWTYLNLSDFIRVTLYTDLHAPLFRLVYYPFVLKLDSEMVMKWPSVIFSILSLGALYNLSLKVMNKKMALMVMAVWGLSFSSLYFAQSLRVYPMYDFFSLVLLHSLLDQNGSKNKFLQFLFYSVILFFTNYMGYILIFFSSIFVYSSIAFRKKLLLIITNLTMILFLIFKIAVSSDEFHLYTFDTLHFSFLEKFFYQGLLDMAHGNVDSLYYNWRYYVAYRILFYFGFIPLLSFVIIKTISSLKENVRILGIIFLLIVFFASLIDLFTSVNYKIQYFHFILPLFLILVTQSLKKLTGFKIYAFPLIVGLCTFFVFKYYELNVLYDAKKLVKQISHQRNGELVQVCSQDLFRFSDLIWYYNLQNKDVQFCTDCWGLACDYILTGNEVRDRKNYYISPYNNDFKLYKTGDFQ